MRAAYGKTPINLAKSTKIRRSTLYINHVSNLKVSKFSYSPSGRNQDYIAFEKQGDNALFAVADGISSFKHSDLAARVAVNAIVKQRQRSGHVRGLEEAFKIAAQRIARIARRFDNGAPVGTTLTAGHIINNSLHVCNTGDSRLYVVRNNKIIFRTTDQSVSDDSEIDSKSPLLLHALVSGRAIQISKSEVELKPNDYILLMTDGVYKLIGDYQLLHLCFCCKSSEELAATVRAYVELKGATDDYSFMVIAYT